MPPDCPECGSTDTRHMPDGGMEKMKDYVCNNRLHAWTPKGYVRSKMG